MPTTLAAWPWLILRRVWPEALVAVLAAVVFLGCLGSVELWGKREQRVSAEAIDTVDNSHWLVAEIQGRPRLEKPPLPRWMIAALVFATGCREEWVVRLPGAVCALAVVALVYAQGRRIGGRAVGLASALVLCSTGSFVGEMRQASSDGPLVLFTTLALFAAWRVIDGECHLAKAPRAWRWWRIVFYAAMGLGFLTKGPVILMLLAVTIVPYLAFSGRLAQGLNRLTAAVGGLLLFAVLAASWPVAVLLHDPNALQLWLLEMSEKTGVFQTLHHRSRSLPLLQWPGMVLPWVVIAVAAMATPFRWRSIAVPGHGSLTAHGESVPRDPSGGESRRSSPLWFAWWCAVGNLGVLSCWAIAKPHYYLPCMPAMALLIGAAWVRLARAARGRSREAWFARAILQTQWVVLFVAAVVAPLLIRPSLPREVWPWSAAIAATVVIAVVLSVGVWRRGAIALSMAPITASLALGVLLAYGVLAPTENSRRSHRALSRTLRQLVPGDMRSLRFFNEIDEGLWFYMRGLTLVPIPGNQPVYNTAYDLATDHLENGVAGETIEAAEARRMAHDRQVLTAWVDRAHDYDSYLLLRANLYDRHATELSGRTTVVYRESGVKRNELVLLHADGRPLAAASTAPIRR
jgi:4-amino-4-deoxy-L-arabinose transferase-like glycosyltransferase